MAIFPDVPGMAVTIDVHGRDVLEYDDDENDTAETATVSKYVEAVSGAEFGIAFRFKPEEYPFGDDSIQYRYYVDGTRANKRTHRLKDIRGGHRIVTQGAVRGSHDTRVSQAMLFSELTVGTLSFPLAPKAHDLANLFSGDDPPDASLINKLSDLGTIRVECYRVYTVPVAREPPKARARSFEEGYDGEESEGARRGSRGRLGAGPADSWWAYLGEELEGDGAYSSSYVGEHCVCAIDTSLTRDRMGPAVPFPVHSGPTQPATHQSVRRDAGPVANFVFKYRSRSALQALHVIPRTPTPVPLEERPVDELSMEEMRELLRRQRASGALSIKQEVKRERHTAFDVDDEDAIEVVSHRNKKNRMSDAGHSGIEVVDLCGD
ncbi:hypothetical protein LTR53_011790 [Teratosphaeriaceae sp. CCFEE 6253]|nr:hypothetical protein LTR53_011790 [Teratosphaeriaceae sp. CCFEE 6253]